MNFVDDGGTTHFYHLTHSLYVSFRNMVTEQDAKDVVEIMKYSLHDTFSDESNSLVFSRSINGSGVSGRAAAKKLIDILHEVCYLT